jgi:hypothetical protein
VNDRQVWATKTAINIVEGRNTSRKDAIKAQCILCSGETYESLLNCQGDKLSPWYKDAAPCPLYPFRLGGGVKREMGEEEKKTVRERLRRISRSK